MTLQPGVHDTAGGWRAFVLEQQDARARIPVAEDDHAHNERAVDFSATAVLVTLSGFGYTIPTD